MWQINILCPQSAVNVVPISEGYFQFISINGGKQETPSTVSHPLCGGSQLPPGEAQSQVCRPTRQSALYLGGKD